MNGLERAQMGRTNQEIEQDIPNLESLDPESKTTIEDQYKIQKENQAFQMAFFGLQQTAQRDNQLVAALTNLAKSAHQTLMSVIHNLK